MGKLVSCKEIADYVVKTVQSESSGFQYIVLYDEIEKEFGIRLDSVVIKEIEKDLWLREEVADIERDNGFDVVLYTDYAPNYIKSQDLS